MVAINYEMIQAALVGLGFMTAETHHITFKNNCKHGTPVLKANGKTLASGKDTTINGPLIAAISFLQDGKCGANGEQCTLIETTLKDPTPGQPGSGSSTDISLIPPHKFSETAGFKYTNAGCKGDGKTCTKPDCKDAFHKPDDTHVQVACQGKNVGLEISFC